MNVTRKVLIGIGSAVMALGLTILAVQVRGPHASRETGWTGSPATLAIEPFRSLAPAPESWTATAFADSLVARLATMPGLRVHRAIGGSPWASEFTLRGDATVREGRLVLATRLYREGIGPPVWTATYWGSDSSSPSLVEEVAADVAGALYGQLARRTSRLSLPRRSHRRRW